MRTRALTLFGSSLLVSTAALAMVACAGGEADDSDTSGGAAGLAGMAGLAGAAGLAGTAGVGSGGLAGSGGQGGSGAAGAGNTGNTSGNGGVGNTSGTGGSGNAGAGNTGGFGNMSGNGGVGNTGNTSGEGGVGNTGNAAGAAGTAGSAGAGGQPDPGPSVEPGQCKTDLGGYQNGSVTFYTFAMGTELVNCSYATHQGNPDRVDFVSTNDGQYFAAINTADYNTAATCGACIEVTRDGNRKVTVTVADRCPIETNNKCKAGHLDLSKAAFLQLGQEQEGYLGTGNGGMYGQISWKFVPCPTEGNVHFRLKEPDNANWNQLLVENHQYQITKVEVRVNGNWVNATRQEYNYWEPPNGTFGMPPYRVRVTDVNGTVLEDTVEFAGGDQEAANQMTCQ